MLEEVGLAYEVRPINIGADEQLSHRFLRVSPNNKIPAIVDHDAAASGPLAVFESGASPDLSGREDRQAFGPVGPRPLRGAGMRPAGSEQACGHDAVASRALAPALDSRKPWAPSASPSMARCLAA